MARFAAGSSSSRFVDLPNIPSAPHQPTNFEFPKRAFGKTKVVYRSFQPTWFKQWPFLHYDETNDVVYCHTCITGFKEKKMRSPHADSAFVSNIASYTYKMVDLLTYCNDQTIAVFDDRLVSAIYLIISYFLLHLGIKRFFKLERCYCCTEKACNQCSCYHTSSNN